MADWFLVALQWFVEDVIMFKVFLGCDSSRTTGSSFCLKIKYIQFALSSLLSSRPCPCGIFMKTESVDRRKIKINLGWSGNDFPLTFFKLRRRMWSEKRDEGNSTSFGILRKLKFVSLLCSNGSLSLFFILSLTFCNSKVYRQRGCQINKVIFIFSSAIIPTLFVMFPFHLVFPCVFTLDLLLQIPVL